MTGLPFQEFLNRYYVKNNSKGWDEKKKVQRERERERRDSALVHYNDDSYLPQCKLKQFSEMLIKQQNHSFV